MRVVSLVISFVLTPLLIKALGPRQFGLYAIVSSFSAYYGILDLGIGSGLVRHLTFYSERKERDVVKQVITFGFVFYIVLGIALSPLVVWSAPLFSRFLHLHGGEAAEAQLLVVVMYAYFIFSSVAGLVTARLISLHRMDLASYCGLLANIFYAFVLTSFIWRFPNLYFVMGASFGQVVIATVLAYAMANRLCPGFFCNPAHLRSAFVRSLLSFGAWSQLCNLSAAINLEGDKLVVGRFLGVTQVMPYQVGSAVASLTRGLPLEFLAALLPEVTAGVSLGMSLAEAQATYARNLRRLMLITVLIAGFLIAVAEVFIETWLGNTLPSAVSITVALTISYTVNNLTGIGTISLKAEGQPKYEAYYAVLSTSVNLLLTIALTPTFGLYGVVGGTIIGNCIGSTFFIVLFHRIKCFPWWSTTGTWLLPLAAGTGAAIMVTRFCLSMVPPDWFQARASGAIVLSAAAVFYLAIAAVVLGALRFWRAEDLDLWRAAESWWRHRRTQPVGSSSETF